MDGILNFLVGVWNVLKSPLGLMSFLAAAVVAVFEWGTELIGEAGVALTGLVALAFPQVNEAILAYSYELSILSAVLPLQQLWTLFFATSTFILAYALFRWIIRFIPTIG